LAELLPVPYFHVVFTLPAPIASIAHQNKAAIYGILFKASAETMLSHYGLLANGSRAQNIAKARGVGIQILRLTPVSCVPSPIGCAHRHNSATFLVPACPA
jgi:methylglyoxal synthase